MFSILKTQKNNTSSFDIVIKNTLKMLKSEEFKKRIIEEDESMLKYLKILQKINSKGYITDESQAGNKSIAISYIDGKSTVYSERAYLSGFML